MQDWKSAIIEIQAWDICCQKNARAKYCLTDACCQKEDVALRILQDGEIFTVSRMIDQIIRCCRIPKMHFLLLEECENKILDNRSMHEQKIGNQINANIESH
jgi:hypothetical protein